MIPSKRSVGLVLAGILVGTFFVAIVKAQENNIIHACVAQAGSNNQSQNLSGGGNTGSVRIVTSESDCRSGETYLTWNTQGPQGIPGPTGVPGPSGPPGPAGGSMKVVDSQNQEVGFIMDYGNRVGRFVSSHWVFFELFENEIPPTNILLEYESADCTGPSYMEAYGIFRYAKVRGTQIYFGGTPLASRHLFSTRYIDANGNYTACERWDHYRSVGPTIIGELPNFVPPFHISQ